MQAVYKYYHKDGDLTLQHFIIFFGVFELFLSQLPDIHSLRWVNALCTFSTIGFAATTIGVTIYNGIHKLLHINTILYSLCQIASLKFIQLDFITGKKIDRKSISYSLDGSSSSKIFRAFNALGAIAFSFGDAMLPEIQVMHTDISFQILV